MKQGVKFVQSVTLPHTDSPCLCDRVERKFIPLHVERKFILTYEVIDVLIVGVHRDLDDHLPVSCK